MRIPATEIERLHEVLSLKFVPENFDAITSALESLWFPIAMTLQTGPKQILFEEETITDSFRLNFNALEPFDRHAFRKTLLSLHHLGFTRIVEFIEL